MSAVTFNESSLENVMNHPETIKIEPAEAPRKPRPTPFFQTELGKLRVTASIGVATFPRDAKSGAELWRCKTSIPWYMCPLPIVQDGVVYCVGGRSGWSPQHLALFADDRLVGACPQILMCLSQSC